MTLCNASKSKEVKEKVCSPHEWHYGPRFMTVEEEIEMLEKAKEATEAQLKNINDRLKKLKA